MKIKINNRETEVHSGETLLEAARREGFDIPSLCYAENAVHRSSCMVCVVRNCADGTMIPACTARPEEGMCIDSESDEVRQTRKLSLELLLSDHRADCEAPCSTVCPYGLDIEQMLTLYDTERHKEAHALIAEVFSLPTPGCDGCKVPCEKVCRRSSVDNPVSIRTIISELAGKYEPLQTEKQIRRTAGEMFNSRLGRFTDAEKERLKETTTTPSGCLHCACEAKDACRLRELATAHGIKNTRYAKDSVTQALLRRKIGKNLWFEEAKCIKCGLCVYNTEDGFTFSGRGYRMRVVLPEESEGNVTEKVTELCPTGALYKKDVKKE